MNAISTPAPEPIPPDPPRIAIVEPPKGPSRVQVALMLGVVAIGLLGVGVWMTGRADPAPAVNSLGENLQWMFDAALTYPGADRSGTIHSAPVISLAVVDVTVADPRQGPLLATVDVSRPDGTIERLTYRIDVVRRGDGWTVTAVSTPARAASRRGS